MVNLANMTPEAIEAWNRLNESWGQPINVISTYRDPATNARVGGAKRSQHMHGNAFDISTAGMTPEQIDALIKAGAKAGFRGFGGYNGSLHFDVGPARTWGPDYGSGSTPAYLKNALAGVEFSQAVPTIMTKGGQAVEPDQIKKDAMAQSTGIMGMAGGQPSGMMDQRTPIKERFRDPDFWNELALTFHSMSSFPNEAAIRSLESRVASSRERKKLQGQMNKTADWLESQGATQLAAGVRGGGLPVASALGMYQKQVAVAQNPNVQSSQMLRDYSGTILTMRDGSIKVLTSGGQELSGQEAMDFIKASEANYTQSQRDIFGARREGTLSSDIALGGEAERVKAEGKAAPEIARANFEDAQTVRSTITNIDNAIAAIDQGAKSGIVYNMLPNMTLASASLSNAMDRLGLDVIGSVTFGALSEGELRLAMETAVPRNLAPAELRQWLVRHKEAQEKAYRALLETAQHFAGGGTMDEYLRKIRAASGSSTSQPTQQPAAVATQPQRRKFDASGNPVRSE